MECIINGNANTLLALTHAEGTAQLYLVTEVMLGDEILKLLDLLSEKREVYRGSTRYLAVENTPVISDAAKDLAERANNYSPENPLYVIAIGAITNIDSAILLNVLAGRDDKDATSSFKPVDNYLKNNVRLLTLNL